MTKASALTRFGVSIPSDLIQSFDQYIRTRDYKNRSEAIRDIIREKLIQKEWSDEFENKEVAGTITYVFDHHKRELVDSILDIQHDFSNEVVALQHVHIDHHNCLEVTIVRGGPKALKQLTNKLMALKGVKHCSLTMTTTGSELS
jgi:CopG family nickel-responsive transcriptional regulator